MSATALIVVDMLNHYEHEDADLLIDDVQRILPSLERMIRAARTRRIETVYVNDNHGDWAAGRPELVKRALAGAAPHVIEPIVPPAELPFVVKRRHSIFYQTLLEYLLHERDVGQIILAGQVTEQCILYSALDAYLRHFTVIVARDCVAHIHEDLADAALRMMERNMHAEVAGTADEALELI
jgi:nicotinamidase-related amidase